MNQRIESETPATRRPPPWSGRGRLYPDDPDLGYMPVYLLGHLAFLTMPWLFGKPMAEVWPTLLAVAAFLPIYFRAWWLSGRDLLPAVALIALIGMLTIPYNWGANVFVIYACAFAGLAMYAGWQARQLG